MTGECILMSSRIGESGGDIRQQYAINAAMVLFFVPDVVCHDHPGSGYVSTWTKPVWRTSHTWALLLAFLRLWVYFNMKGVYVEMPTGGVKSNKPDS